MLRKKDIILIMIVFLIAAVLVIIMRFSHDTADKVLITIDGTVYGEYSLNENRDILIDNEHGHNHIIIENGHSYMSEADCPDKYCMDYKPISKGGEMIICLPHKLVVEVTGDAGEEQPDIISQ